MLVVLGMYIQYPLKVQRPDGKQCQGTGARTGKAILTLMAKASLSSSRPVTDTVLFLSTLLHPVGPSDRLTLEASLGLPKYNSRLPYTIYDIIVKLCPKKNLSEFSISSL